MSVHVARIGLVHITAAGSVKQRTDMNIGEVARSNTESRILPDATLPNAAAYPTLTEYLNLEDSDGFRIRHLDQTYVITDDS